MRFGSVLKRQPESHAPEVDRSNVGQDVIAEFEANPEVALEPVIGASAEIDPVRTAAALKARLPCSDERVQFAASQMAVSVGREKPD